MSARKKFEAVFGGCKPILGMIHLKTDGTATMIERAKKEIDLLLLNDVTAVVIENYFGSEEDVEIVLDYLQHERRDVVYGVNMLDNDARGFEAAAKYNAKFIQLDSVAGHLTPEEDYIFAKTMEEWKRNTKALVLGGVRFKYQPYKSGRSLKEDLRLGMERCDAIVVTGDGTGLPTAIEKIQSFRGFIGDFPLIVGAGMTPESCFEQLSLADGAIVGSYFKDTYKDDGDMSAQHIRALMETVEGMRK